MSIKTGISFLLLTALAIVTACQAQGPVAQGQEAYETVGCISCHGTAGEGGVGPALAGHAAEKVRRRVRTPRGTMPAYTEEQLSDEQLGALIAWIDSLELPEAGHGHGEFEATAEVSAHLRLILDAVQAENADDARHHLEHLLEVATGEVKEQAEVLETLLDEKDWHEMEHALEDLLMETGEPALEGAELHLQLALDSLLVGTVEDAVHHLEHAVEGSQGEADKSGIQEALAYLEDGETDEAEHRIEDLLGGH